MSIGANESIITTTAPIVSINSNDFLFYELENKQQKMTKIK